MEQSSSFVQHQPFQLSLLCHKFQLDWLHRKDGEKDARTERGKQDCGEIQADGDELGHFCSYCSSSVNSPIASRSPGILKASSRQVGLSGKLGANTSQNSNPDAASSSHGWQRDAQLFISTGGLVATDEDQKSLKRQEKSIINTGELVATGYQGYPENPETPGDYSKTYEKSRINL